MTKGRDEVVNPVTNALLAAAVEGAEEHRELPLPAWAFGVIALGVFIALFLLLWSFRSLSTRH